MKRAIFLNEVKDGLSRAFGARSRGLFLFSSEARGSARAESVIEFLCLLDGKIKSHKDNMKISGIVLPNEREMEPPRIRALTPACYEDFESEKWPLFREVKRKSYRFGS